MRKKPCVRLLARKHQAFVFYLLGDFYIIRNNILGDFYIIRDHLLGDFYIIRDHILAFCFSSFQKHLGTFHEHFFEAFFYYFDNIWLMNLQIFFYTKKKLYEKLLLKNGSRLFIVLLPSVIYAACITDKIMIFMNQLNITQKSLENYFK